MAGSVKVDFGWLYHLHDDLKDIREQFEAVDESFDFSVRVFGDQRVVDALTKFTRDWTDGRNDISQSVNSLAGTLWTTAHNYEHTDAEVARAATVEGR